MKKYLYWIVAPLVLGFGVFLISRLDLETTNISKIKAVQVEDPTVFGQAIYRRLQAELSTERVMFLGVTPGQAEDLEVWKGFLDAARSGGAAFEVVIIESKLPFADVLSKALPMELKENLEGLAGGVRRALEKNLRVAVIGPSIYSSQLLKRNPVDLLKLEHGVTMVSLSIVKFPVTPQQESVFEPACSVDKEDLLGTGPLGCAIRSKAHGIDHRKAEANKYTGLVDQVGAKDYLVLWNRN